jgi:anaerobic magnesium-protoporphyrin IX monomethyl ester cyclase
MHTPTPQGDILLLETPFLSQTGNEEVKAYVQSKYNLALLALGSYIRAHSDLDVYLINMVKDRLDEDELLARLRSRPPKVVGVPLYSYNLSHSYRIISRIKQAFPDTHICVGGPHTRMFPEETVRLPNVDSMVRGDGEEPFLQVCRQVLDRGRLNEERLPPGTTTKASLAAGFMAEPWAVEDLDALPIPDLTLLGDYRRYRDFLSNRTMAILTTSRGCPYACHYCSSQHTKYRSFSVERVVEIMRHYQDEGIEYIEFWDETFNPNKRRLEAFADALLESGLRIPWSIRGAVVLHAPHNTLVKLKETGLRVMQFGVETSQDRLARYLNKRIDRTHIRGAFQNCRKAGVRTVANLMTNIPGQTEDEMLDDLAFLREIQADYISISVYNWAPGTTHYKTALEDGTLDRDHWREYAENPQGEEPVIHPINGVPIDRVYAIRDRFVWRYYFNPRYIFRYLRMAEPCEFKRAFSVALLMFRSRLDAIWTAIRRRPALGPTQQDKPTRTAPAKPLVQGLPEPTHTMSAESMQQSERAQKTKTQEEAHQPVEC